MTELYFLRHGQRIDHALTSDPNAKPLIEDFKAYDPSLSTHAVEQVDETSKEITLLTTAFGEGDGPKRKNVFIHFSPYLRCCQTADLLITHLKPKFEEKFPNYKIRFQLLGDFALSEWIHDKMKNKPPFVDSNDAYQMYTPNVKLLKNKSACSNFRPTNTLGHYNGYDLSYKSYQTNCKDYFKKLLATYNKSSNIKNQDIIIVVSHGYLINNVLSYFVNHPIFDEIPEAKVNYAQRVYIGPKENPNPDILEDYQWQLIKDSLDLFNFDIDKSLNLETDIIYYKTNFIKRDELHKDADLKLHQSKEEKPRPSFKIPQTSMGSKENQRSLQDQRNKGTKDNHQNPQIINNPICPAAKDWLPQSWRKFQIKNEFALKRINSDAFKQDYDITKPPAKPISPEVSPNSEPTRNNSVIDLSLLDEKNKDHRPMKLKYSNTSDIPIHHLNSKVNSQVNLAQYHRSNPSSNNSSTTDFPKFLSGIKKTTSNPVNVTHRDKDSYFPLHVVSPKLNSANHKHSRSNESISSLESIDSNDLESIQERPQVLTLQRASSNTNTGSSPLLQRNNSRYRKELAMNSGRSILAMYQRQHNQNNSDNDDNDTNGGDNSFDNDKRFTLSFSNDKSSKKSLNSRSVTSSPPQTRSRKNSVKFIPSVASDKDRQGASTPVGMYSSAAKQDDNLAANPVNGHNKSKSMFYNLNSDSDSNFDLSDASEGEDNEGSLNMYDNNEEKPYMWFGQNRS